jgi:hypothetical protein
MSSKKIGLAVEVIGFLSVLAGAVQSIKHVGIALPVFLGAVAIFVGRLLASGETIAQVGSTISSDVQRIGAIARTDLQSFAARLKSAAGSDATFIATEARSIATSIESKI